MNFPRSWQNLFAGLILAFACWMAKELITVRDDVKEMKIEMARLIKMHETKTALLHR